MIGLNQDLTKNLVQSSKYNMLKPTVEVLWLTHRTLKSTDWDILQLKSELAHWMKSSNEDEIKSSKNTETSQKKMRMWKPIATVSYAKDMFFMWGIFININLHKLFLLITVFQWRASFNVLTKARNELKPPETTWN